MLQEAPPGGEEGLIAVRGHRWRVLGVVSHQDCEAWQLAGLGEAPGAATLLVPFDRPRAVRRDPRPRRVGRRRWMAALGALAAATAGYDQLRAAASATIDLLPYQLEPVLACLTGATRILLADQVGLGKTIQAGLIVSELAARGEGERVLVLAPAGLCSQWKRELEERFHLAPLVVDAAGLRQLALWPSLEAGPWQRVPLAIASLDFVKRPEVLRGLSPARYDLLVVDEAHTCAHARERSEAVTWLARRSRRVVMLTATPHDGDPAAFDALCDMGRHPGEPPLVAFRRTRDTLGSTANRRVHLLRLRLSPPEKALHAALERYTTRVWRARARDPLGRHARLAMVVLRKRAASGPTALMLSIARRLDWLSRAGADEALQLQLPLAVEADLEDEDAPPDALLAAPGLDDVESERRTLRRLVEAARVAAGHEAKIVSLRRLLARAGQPAIVFTEYRDTLDRLVAALTAHGPIAVLHGGLAPAERDEAIVAFNGGRAAVLLATDAAAHGLNLQARCCLVVNFELPWNPVRLEQRIGRVDRIGQRRRVHAFNLVGAGTCEDVVVGRLVTRIERARHCLGPLESLLGRVGEDQVAGAVFEGRAVELDRNGQQATGSGQPQGAGGWQPEGAFGALATREAARLEQVRRLARGRPAPVPPRPGRTWRRGDLLAGLERRAPWCSTVPGRRRHGLSPGLWCVCRVSMTDKRGRIRDRTLLALHLERGEPSTIPQIRSALEGAAASAAAARSVEVARSIARLAETSMARERAMAALDLEPPSPVQPGLFDRRALAGAERAAWERERAARELGERLSALERGGEIAGARAELLLVLVVPG